MDGRKIPSKYENPIDNLLIYFSKYISIFLYNNMPFITPNILTTFSLIISLYGIYFVYLKYYKLGAILYFIGYFFDCLDGHYARRYDMVTVFGDYYDHISDFLKYVLLIVVILILNIKIKTKIIVIALIIFFVFFAILHLCYQELNSTEKNFTVLKYTSKMCNNSDYIIYSKYFGVGTSMTIITLLVCFIKELNNLI